MLQPRGALSLHSERRQWPARARFAFEFPARRGFEPKSTPAKFPGCLERGAAVICTVYLQKYNIVLDINDKKKNCRLSENSENTQIYQKIDISLKFFQERTERNLNLHRVISVPDSVGQGRTRVLCKNACTRGLNVLEYS